MVQTCEVIDGDPERLGPHFLSEGKVVGYYEPTEEEQDIGWRCPVCRHPIARSHGVLKETGQLVHRGDFLILNEDGSNTYVREKDFRKKYSQFRAGDEVQVGRYCGGKVHHVEAGRVWLCQPNNEEEADFVAYCGVSGRALSGPVERIKRLK